MKLVCKARLKIKEDKTNEGFHTFYVIELDEIGFLFNRKATGGLKNRLNKLCHIHRSKNFIFFEYLPIFPLKRIKALCEFLHLGAS
jgi:hypothetical protein